MKKQLLMKTFLVAVCLLVGINSWADDEVVPTPVYSQDFEEASIPQGSAGSNFGITGATLTGSGAIQTGDALFGQYYQNMPDATEVTKNANFLTLTTDAFTKMQTASVKTVTISFWINAFNSTLTTNWGSLFVAYGESGNTNHGYPYGFDIRNTLAVHTNVWRAFYHDNGSQNSSWLSKGESLADSWHHVAVVYTEDRTDAADIKLVIKQYVDGTLMQSFSLTNGWDGDDIGNRAYSLLDDMGRLTEFCIGGNSSENWNDPDNQYAYDEINIYNVALSEAQINQIRTNKLSRTVTGTQIGLKSNGSGYVAEGAMTDKVTLKPGESYHYSFINYNRGFNNWNNFVVPVWDESDNRVITVRADNYEDMHHVEATWGSNAGCTSNFNWTNFPGNMNGATVDMTVTFTADKVFNMSSTINTVDGSEWSYSYTNDYKDSPIVLTGNTYIKVALAVSHSWLDLLSEGYSAVAAKIGGTGWTTFASAYPLNLYSMTASTGEVTAYYASSIGDGYVKMTSTESTGVAAGEGLMLKGTSGATITIPVAASGESISGNMLKGCTTSTVLAADATSGYNNYVLVNNNGSAEFQSLVEHGATIPAGKAYLQNGTYSSVKALRIVFEDNEETAITETTEKTEATEDLFDLSGRRVSKAQKGIFIANGKKVVVK